jgi:hypothetical protein
MKRKLRLNVDALRVESFGTLEGPGAQGTVHAHGYTDPDYPSCARTCGATPPPDTSVCYAGFAPTLQQACCV